MKRLFILFLSVLVSLSHLSLAQPTLDVNAPVVFNVTSGTVSSSINYVTRADTKVNIVIKGISNPANLTVTVGSSGKKAQVISTTDIISQIVPDPTSPPALKAVRIMLTKNSYQTVNSLDTSVTTGSGPGFDILNPAPSAWTFPLLVTVLTGGPTSKTLTASWFKFRPPTGATFADAMLMDSMRLDKDPALYRVLALYDSTGAKQTSISSLTAYYNAKPGSDSLPRNPWLRDYFLLTDVPEPTNSIRAALVENNDEKANKGFNLGSLGALSNPTLAADALATFIAKRFREEINVAFLKEFRKKLEADPILPLVFPQTKGILSAVDPYAYTTFLESMKTAFQEDLDQFPIHSAELLDTLKARGGLPDTTPLMLVGLSLRSLQTTLDTKGDYWGGLRQIGQMTNPISTTNVALRSTLAGASLLLNALLTNDSNRVQRVNFQPFIKSEEVRKVALGLLLARYPDLVEKVRVKLAGTTTPQSLTTVLRAPGSSTGVSYTLVTALVKQASLISDAIAKFETTLKNLKAEQKKQSGDAPGLTVGSNSTATINNIGVGATPKLLSYTDLALRFTETLDALLTVEMPGATTTVQFRQKLVAPVHDVVFAFKHVQEKNYALAVIFTANALVGMYGQASTTTEALKKYGTFMTTVVKAETRDQMVEALETAALPVGSYRIKRNNFFNVTINSYGGIMAGRDQIRLATVENPVGGSVTMSASASSVQGTAAFVAAPYAPLGVALSWGRNANYLHQKEGNSFSLVFNIIDVGSLAAVRVGNKDATASLPDFTWGNLLAPGGYAVIGLRNVLSVGIGAQFGPELRKINLKDNTAVLDAKSWRIGLTLAADIPVFNLYTRANSRKVDRWSPQGLTVSAQRPKRKFLFFSL